MSERVTVFGAGYVGLITGVCLAHSGHDVTVLDTDAAKVARLSEGTPTIHEPQLAEYLAEGLAAGRLRFTIADDAAIEAVDGIAFVAVGTPPTAAGAADLSAVRAVVDALAEDASAETLVVMKSTVPPGTGERFAEQLAARGIAYTSNPEFLREGSAVADWYDTDRIVIGGEDAACARLAALYGDVEAPVVACDIASAELIKYASNAFLATKISFINEIATLCDLVGADVDLVARGVGMDRRIGTAFLKPGIGWGGSCFPKDTRALDFLATLHGYDFHLLRAVIDVNSRQRLLPVRALVDHWESIEGRTVAVLGLTFKPDTDDVREAPASEIVALLLAEGAKVRAYNPVPVPVPAGASACGSLADCVAGADAVVVATEWREIAEADWHALAGTMVPGGIVFDGRNALDPHAVRAAGVTYVGVGRP
ncbi:MAG: UDP-glucose/GDP-mannose dehydrogenase family protein [Actinobacteria bacterium]|nr:MAG: UDP-glucose/GDP-mannose dehydrogenase family protein [Actinomycetota bacterium]